MAAASSREMELLGSSVAVAAMLTGGTAFWMIPDLLSRLPACIFKGLTGQPCLTCGGTRTVLALLRLDPATALAMNPAVALGLMGLAAWLGYAALVLAGALAPVRLGLLRPPLHPVLRWGVLAALAGNWIYLLAAGR